MKLEQLIVFLGCTKENKKKKKVFLVRHPLHFGKKKKLKRVTVDLHLLLLLLLLLRLLLRLALWIFVS